MIKNKYDKVILLEQQNINNTILELSYKLTELDDFKNNFDFSSIC